MKTRPIQPPPVRCAQCRRKLPKGTVPHPGLLCIDCHVEDFKGPDGKDVLGAAVIVTVDVPRAGKPRIVNMETPAFARLRARHEEKMAALRGVAAALGMDWGPVLDEATRRVVAYAKRPDYVDAMEELRKDMLAGTWAPK